MIIRELLFRFWASRAWNGKSGSMAIDSILILVIAVSVFWYASYTPINSVDHFLWQTHSYRSAPFEFLIAVLGLPLLALCLAGWIRLIVIWKSLRSELLERLEYQPLRFAFSRLNVMGWMTMLRHGGLQEQWRDMARSVESMRQLLHAPDLQKNVPESSLRELKRVNEKALAGIDDLRQHMDQQPSERKEHDYDFITRIECDFAWFAQKLLALVLIPYWNEKRVGLVSGDEFEELPIRAKFTEPSSAAMELHAAPSSEEPQRILLAGEFVAIRYISLIRAVLSNMRYLMIFVSASFVLAMVAWNSYPFQPRQLGDGLFTVCLVLLGSGMVWVLAQMYRNPILSRITDTKANELGWDFYLRIVSYGAAPVLAWLAYQFPDVAHVISKFIQPGVPVIK